MNTWIQSRLIRACVPVFLLVATSSALAQYRVVWGDLHGHTAFSDGKGSLDAYFTHARDKANLDFAIVTDHDFGNGHPWRMPKEHWTQTQEKADHYNAKGRFVAIAGYEWTSQPKYWTDVDPDIGSERLFPGPPKFYNHKNVYFPGRVDYLFSAKEPAYQTPDLLADAVRKAGGLIHNNHPDSGAEGRDQFAYKRSQDDVIVNTEMLPDFLMYEGKEHHLKGEQTLREFLGRGGRTGFVSGSDTHEGTPEARTAVLVRELTREAVFDALRHRRNYAVSRARILLDVRIEGHFMGEDIEIDGKPRLTVEVRGTAPIEEVSIIRDGVVVYSATPRTERIRLRHTDRAFSGPSYYYVRVIQTDRDQHGNKSHAWSSPIWVRSKRR